MVVMFDVTAPVEREHAMAKREITPAQFDWKAVLTSDEDGFRALLQTVVQEVLEAEMTEALQAEKNERTASRLGHRSGYYERKLVTRIGVLELRVPQDRAGRFSTELFERYQRSEKALVAALAEMYVQGVSTRKVKQVTEELVGYAFSALAISAINKLPLFLNPPAPTDPAAFATLSVASKDAEESPWHSQAAASVAGHFW